MPDSTAAARALIATLPAFIEQAEATGAPLRLAVYGMRTALAEAQRFVDATDRSRPVTSTAQLLRRLGG